MRRLPSRVDDRDDVYEDMGVAIMSDIRETFDKYDKDGNGKIDLQEFRELLAELGDTNEPAKVETLFDEIDEDETGIIDFEEFEAWWSER